MLIRAAEKACLQRRYRQALAFIRQALDIWSADFEPDARLRILQEMARCAMNCREHSISRLAWEEILNQLRTLGDSSKPIASSPSSI
jgi:hypothetical protein